MKLTVLLHGVGTLNKPQCVALSLVLTHPQNDGSSLSVVSAAGTCAESLLRVKISMNYLVCLTFTQEQKIYSILFTRIIFGTD